MTMPSRQLHLRLPDRLAEKFDSVCAEFPAIQPAVILRLLVASVLEKNNEEVVDVLMRQLRKPGAQISRKRSSLNSRNRLNSD